MKHWLLIIDCAGALLLLRVALLLWSARRTAPPIAFILWSAGGICEGWNIAAFIAIPQPAPSFMACLVALIFVPPAWVGWLAVASVLGVVIRFVLRAIPGGDARRPWDPGMNHWALSSMVVCAAGTVGSGVAFLRGGF